MLRFVAILRAKKPNFSLDASITLRFDSFMSPISRRNRQRRPRLALERNPELEREAQKYVLEVGVKELKLVGSP